MKKVHSYINSTGFSLVEILVAISIFLVFVLATTGVIVTTYKSIRHTANGERAAFLAEEAMEAVRNLRDTDFAFASLPNGTYGLSIINNQWNLSGSSDTQDIFTRSTTISTINGSQKKITVNVSWSDQVSNSNSVTSSTYLTDWRAPLNIGLTIDKIVINHGDTKVPSDFLPTSLTTTAWDYSVDPPVQNTVNIPITFSPSTMSLGSGSYAFVTSNNSNYSLVLSNDCGGGNITLANGDAKICNITYEQYYAPIVTTPTVTSIGTSTATLGANVTSLGNPATISARGTCWGTNSAPTINCLDEGSTTIGVFNHIRTGFTPNTTYYYRGYATNSVGTGYSEDGTFTTSNNTSQAVVTTLSPIINITRTTASGGGTVTSDGGSAITARGVVWDTAANPTIALSTKTNDGTGTGVFSSNITGLLCNTLYHVRSYATNSNGTVYGADVTFSTTACSSLVFVGQGTANGTTAVIPAHNVGDLIIVFAYRDGNITPPTIPAGWTVISNSTGSNSNSSAIAYRIATGVDSGSGFAGGTELVTLVYRGASASPIGSNSVQNGVGSTATYPSISLSVTDGSSWVIGFAGDSDKSTTIENPPSGTVLRANIVGGSAEASGSDTNTGVSSWSAKNVSLGKNVNWSARVLEIKSQ